MTSLLCRSCSVSSAGSARPLYQTFQNKRGFDCLCFVTCLVSLNMSMYTKALETNVSSIDVYCTKKWFGVFSIDVYWRLFHPLRQVDVLATSHQVPCRPGRSLNCASAGWRSFEVGLTNCHPPPPWLLKPGGDLMSWRVQVQKCKSAYAYVPLVLHIDR